MARTGTATTSRLTTGSYLAGSAGPWTWMAWVKPDNLTGSNHYLYQEVTGTAGPQHAVIWEYVNNTYEFFSSGHSGTDPRTNSGIVVSDANYHHICWRKDGSGTSSYNKFLDGAKTEISSGIAFTLSSVTTASLFSATNGGAYFPGAVAYLAIWNAAVPDEYVAAIAAGAHPLIYPNGLQECFELTGASSGNEVGRLGDVFTQAGTVGTAESPLVTLGGAWPANYTPAAGGGAAVSPTAGSLTLTGATPSIALLINRSLTAGALTLTGEQPGVLVEAPGVTEVQPNAGVLTLTGESPAIALKIDRSPTAASLTLTGEQPSVAVESFKDVQPTAASLTLTGASPSIALKVNVSPSVATLSITGAEIGVSVPGLGRTTSAGSSKGRRRTQRGYPRRVVIDGVVYTVRSAEELRRLLAAQQERLQEELLALPPEAPAIKARSLKRQITVVQKKIDATERDYMQAILDDDDEVITVWAMLQ